MTEHQRFNPLYVVYTFEKARQLTKLGFQIVAVDRNRDDTTKLVFYFESTEEFKQAFKKLN